MTDSRPILETERPPSSHPRGPTAEEFNSRDYLLASAVFFLLLAIYLLTFNGLFRSIEELKLFATAESLWRGQWPALPQLEFTRYQSPVGVLEMGSAMAALPLYSLSQLFTRVGNIQAVSLVNVLVSALIAPVLYLVFRSLGSRPKGAALLALLVGIGTLIWPWSRVTNREPLSALLFAMALLATVRFQLLRKPYWALVTLGVLLVSMTIKVVTFFALPFFAVPVAVWLYRESPRATVILGSGVAAGSSLLFAALLTSRGWNIDAPLQNLKFLFSNEGLQVLPMRTYGLLLSPGKGLFIYSPILLGGFLGALVWMRRGRWEGYLVSGVLLSYVVIYSFIYGVGWGGGLDWGPRYLVPLVPLLAVPLHEFMSSWRRRLFLFLLAVPSVAIQIVASSANWATYWHQLVDRIPGEGEFYLENGVLLDPRNLLLSPVMGQFLTWRPSNFDMVWLRPQLTGEPASLQLHVLLTVLVLLAIALAFLFYALRRRPWQEGRKVLVAVGLAFAAGILVFLQQAYAVPSSYPEVNTRAIRAMADEVNASPGSKLLVSVSNQFQYNAIMNFLKGDLTHYWLSPAQAFSLDILKPSVDTTERTYLILDHIPPRTAENEGALRWLLSRAHFLSNRWYGGYRFYEFAPPLPEEKSVRRIWSAELAAEIPNPINATYGSRLRLRGYELLTPQAKENRFLYVTLFWEVLRPIAEDDVVSLTILSPQDEVLGQVDLAPGRPGLQPRRWQAGDAIVETYAVPVRTAPVLPLAGWLQVIVYNPNTGEHLALTDAQGNPLHRVLLGPFRVVPGEVPSYSIRFPAEAQLADEIALLGYDLDPAPISPADDIRLTLFWKALQSPSAGYTVFTHLIDGQGRVWGQKDSPPLSGGYPTFLWVPGETVGDDYIIPVDPAAPAGQYRIAVGMYLPDTGERLDVSGPDGDEPRRRILLPFTVTVR